MLEIPENNEDVKKILYKQLSLLAKESEVSPEKIAELTNAMCSLVFAILQL